MGINNIRDISPERTYSVNPSFILNDHAHQSPTIQGAIDMAIANVATIDDYFYQVLILVYPGKYEEQIHSIDGIHIVGVGSQDNRYTKGPRLYMPGTDSTTYPLRAELGDMYRMYGMQIESEFATGIITELPELGVFTNCYFRGRFIESSKDEHHFLLFDDCEIRDATNKSFDLTGTDLLGSRNIAMKHSIITRCNPSFSSTHIGEAIFRFEDGSVMGQSSPHINGDWDLYGYDSNLANGRIGIEDRMIIGGLGDINIVNCSLTSGIHFTADPGDVKILNSLFKGISSGIPVGEPDITADVDIVDITYIQNIQENGISGRIQTTNNVVNVGGDSINRYCSIQDAIDSLPTDGIVSLMPGTYTEQIHSTAAIHIQGRTHEGVPKVKATVLYNTGADAAHYPLGGDDTDVFTISDITIKTEPGAVIGKLSPSNFTGVVFENGHFIEATANQAMLTGFVDCSFENSMAFNLTGVGSGGMRAMTIIGCYFNDHPTHWVMDSTHANTLVIVKNTMFHNFYPDVGGNWQVEYSNSHCFGTSRSVISTTNKVAYIQNIISNGLHFTSNPDVVMHLNTFTDDCGYLITGADITADVDITDVDYTSNVQQNGLSGRIKINCPVKNVGCNMINRYMTIQDALDSCNAIKASVVAYQDFANLAKLTLPANCDITIDCQREYSMSFIGDIVDVGADQTLNFIRYVNLSGSKIDVNGNNAVLSFEATQYINAYITLTAGTGSFCVLYNSSLTAAAGHPAITINNTDTLLVTGYSRVKGITGYPAILFSVDADERFKSKFSTLIHGDLGTNSPIQYTGAGKVDISVYNTGLNAAWNAAQFNNLIGSANNTTDPNIDF